MTFELASLNLRPVYDLYVYNCFISFAAVRIELVTLLNVIVVSHQQCFYCLYKYYVVPQLLILVYCSTTAHTVLVVVLHVWHESRKR